MIGVAVTQNLSCNPELYSRPTSPRLFLASWAKSELVSLLVDKFSYMEDLYSDMQSELAM